MSLKHHKKRIFIAIKLYPDEYFLEVLTQLRQDLENEKIRWVNKENLHLTLRFIGDCENEKIDLITNILQAIAENRKDFQLTVEGLGVFRSLSYPKVLWAGIKESEDLLNLKVEMDESLNEIGFDFTSESFSPHLTLGRMKRIKDRQLLKTEIQAFKNEVLLNQQVESVILFESILSREGPRYKPLQESFFKYRGP